MASLNMKLVKPLFGDWEKVGHWFSQAESSFEKFGNDPMRECAELYKKTLISNIEGQSLAFAPLSQAYLARKAALGLDTRILIAKSSYIGSIEIREMGSFGGRMAMYVGPNESTHYSGLPMTAIASIHEYGASNGIPARPHYRPTWEQVRSQCRNIWLKHFRASFGI